MENKKVISIPFSGNKRIEYNKYIRNIFAEMENKKIKVLDAFGGSGVIAVNLKRDFPEMSITLNDYDKLFLNGILKEAYELLNRIIMKCEEQKIPHGKLKLSEYDFLKLREIIKSEINEEQKNNSVIIRNISNNFLFSASAASGKMEFEKFIKNVFFYMNDRNIQKRFDYLKEIKKIDKIISVDALKINYADYDVVILDPPYLNSVQKQYNNDFFGLYETITMLQKIPEGKKAIVFNQNKRDFKKILEIANFKIIQENFLKKNISQGGKIGREDACFLIMKKGGQHGK